MDKVVVLLALFTLPNFNSLNVNFKIVWSLSVLAHFFTGLENLPSNPFLLDWEWEPKSRTGHWEENGKNFKYWMGIQPSAASAKKFRKLSRSPIWGFYSVAVVYNAGIDRVTGNR